MSSRTCFCPSVIVVSVTSLTGEVIPVAVDRRAFVNGVMSLPIVGLLGREIPDLSVRALEGNVRAVVRPAALACPRKDRKARPATVALVGLVIFPPHHPRGPALNFRAVRP